MILELFLSGFAVLMMFVHAQTLDAVSSIAVCVDDAFLPYYSTFISGIHAMIASPATSSADVTVKVFRSLYVRQPAAVDVVFIQGKALQCLAAIGEAVGKEKFAADGAAAMEVITKVSFFRVCCHTRLFATSLLCFVAVACCWPAGCG